MKAWTLDDYIKFTFDCLSTEKNKCRDKYVSSDNMTEEDFNECYDFVNHHKWDFYSLFAESLKRNHAESFN